MEFPITEKFRKFEEQINLPYFENTSVRQKFLNSDEETIVFRINKFTKKGYENVEERYVDILTIDTFHFHAWLEVDDYGSQVEFNISKVFTGLSLLDFDDKLWFKGQSPEEIALWKTFRVLDTRPEIRDGKMAVFSIQEGVSPPNEPAIYYIDRASCWKTNLTFVQYYEAVLDMMGIADWQLLFTDVSLKDPMVDYYYHGLKGSLEALAKAFPDKDYSKYFELLEARWV
jgi:hypothetical protein